MDWVHCNSCFTLPGRDKRFFLTSCGHIFCSDCKTSCASGVCKLCGNPCSCIPLSSQMKPNVEVYFTDASDLMRKYCNQVQQTYEFQKNHRARLISYLARQDVEMRKLKKEFAKVIQKAEACESERQRLLKENRQLRQLLQSSRGGSHPAEHLDPGNFISPPSGFNGSYGSLNEARCSSVVKRNNPNTRAYTSPADSVSSSQRVSVLGPPVNGRMGSIGSVVSPSSIKSLGSLVISPNETRQRTAPKEMLRRMMIGNDSPQSISSSGSRTHGPGSLFCTPESLPYSPEDRNSSGSGNKKIRV